MRDRQLEKKWKQLKKSEKRFLEKNRVMRVPGWQHMVEEKMPKKLDETLRKAFCKAFMLVFEKGTGVIETVSQKDRKEKMYKINEYTMQIKKNKRSLGAFEKQAKAGRNVNMAVSAVEGIGMGALGMGIPDIPVFLSVVLKGIYEIALSYGFSYDTEEEQIFILKLIETSLSHGTDLLAQNAALDRWIQEPYRFEVTRQDQIEETAWILAGEMLYLKFIQGIPLVGIAGGVSDIVYLKKITDYAELKYRRRFLKRTERGKHAAL